MNSEKKADTESKDKPKSMLSVDYRRHAKAAVYDGLNDYDEVLAASIAEKGRKGRTDDIRFEKMSYAEVEKLSEQSEEPGFGDDADAEDESLLAAEEAEERAMAEEAAETERDSETVRAEETDAGRNDGIGVWECSRCGSKMMGAQDFKGFLCPYCNGLMEIVPKSHVDTWASYIVPFRKTRADAVEAFRRMEKQGLINTTKPIARMERTIYGMYIPFYLCCGDVSGRVEYRRNYKGTQQMPIHLNRFGGVTLRGVPQDALSELPDTMIDTIGPFDSRNMEKFSSEWLMEHPASIATETIRDMSGRIRSKMESAARSAFVLDQEVPEGMTAWNSRLRTTNMDFEKAYLPVFFTVAAHGDKKVWFVMNGQTGRAAVLEPMSRESVDRNFRWIMGFTYAASTILMAMFLILEFLSIRAGYVWGAALLTVLIGVSVNVSMREELFRKKREWHEGVAIDALWYAHRVDFRDDFRSKK